MDSNYLFLGISSMTGLICGLSLFYIYHRVRLGGYQKIASNIVQEGENNAESLKKLAEVDIKQKRISFQKEIEQEWLTQKKKWQKEEGFLKQREEKIEKMMSFMEKKLNDLDKRELSLKEQWENYESDKIKLKETQSNLNLELEKVASLSKEEAKERLMTQLRQELRSDAGRLIEKCTREAELEAEKEAQRILATAINRLAVPCVSECTVQTITIPNDEMKGRIIGREGRNIRALERATGVNFLIDDTPGTIVLSGFDPIRLQVAKTALTELVADGRIHPTRIDESVEKAQEAVARKIRSAGEDAAMRAGQINLHPEIIILLGKLKFRFSLGQNVLDHSLEVSHLMGLMAAELGLNTDMAKRIGLLHDIGKAVSHEMEGTHALIGKELALKYNESPEVANGIGCHHGEIAPTTVEASLCSAADALSASRPGARVEAIEEYVKRLKRLEEIAFDFPGVERAYAMQAGREVQIVVLPDMIDDIGITHLARDLTKRIEQELRYTGKIKVTVIREKRAVEYAIS